MNCFVKMIGSHNNGVEAKELSSPCAGKPTMIRVTKRDMRARYDSKICQPEQG